MTRRMSCSLTIDQVRNRSKLVTRRHVDTWRTLKAGDVVTLIEKGMGLPKGARQIVLANVTITAVDVVPLRPISLEELALEGFPEMTATGFAAMWCQSHGYPQTASPDVRRIEWVYLTPAACEGGAHPRSTSVRRADGTVVLGWWRCETCLVEWPGPVY